MSESGEGLFGIASSEDMAATVRIIGGTAAMSVSWVREAHEEVYSGRVVARGANRILSRIMGDPIEEGGDHEGVRFKRSRHRTKDVVVESGMVAASPVDMDPTEPPLIKP